MIVFDIYILLFLMDYYFLYYMDFTNIQSKYML